MSLLIIHDTFDFFSTVKSLLKMASNKNASIHTGSERSFTRTTKITNFSSLLYHSHAGSGVSALHSVDLWSKVGEFTRNRMPRNCFSGRWWAEDEFPVEHVRYPDLDQTLGGRRAHIYLREQRADAIDQPWRSRPCGPTQHQTTCDGKAGNARLKTNATERGQV